MAATFTAVTNPTQNNPFAFTGLQLGDKYVKETTQADWTLHEHHLLHRQRAPIRPSAPATTGADFASPGGAGFNPGDTTVKAVITAGDTPTCTFENTRNASLDIEKSTVGGTATFGYTGQRDGPQSRSTATPRSPTRRRTTPSPSPVSRLETS